MARRTTGKVLSATGTSSASSVDQEEVARVAYEFYLKRGGTHGQDMNDWLEAERLVRERRRARAIER